MKFNYLYLVMILFISACSTVKPAQTNICPPCAVAGPKVAEELEKVCDEKICPNTIEWLNRHAKVCDILTSMQED